MQNNKGGNPQVYQVHHDVSEEGEEIEGDGMVGMLRFQCPISNDQDPRRLDQSKNNQPALILAQVKKRFF